MYKPQTEFLVCWDTNTNYLIESNQRKQLASALTTLNLSNKINFATKIRYYSSTAIDNILEYNGRIKLSSISSIINGLSDYDAPILITKNIHNTINKFPLKQRTKLTDNATIMNFQTLLTRTTSGPIIKTNIF